jgi:hypothetical protein
MLLIILVAAGPLFTYVLNAFSADKSLQPASETEPATDEESSAASHPPLNPGNS